MLETVLSKDMRITVVCLAVQDLITVNHNINYDYFGFDQRDNAVNETYPMISAAAVVICFPSPNGFLGIGDFGNVIGGGGSAADVVVVVAVAVAGVEFEEVEFEDMVREEEGVEVFC